MGHDFALLNFTIRSEADKEARDDAGPSVLALNSPGFAERVTFSAKAPKEMASPAKSRKYRSPIVLHPNEARSASGRHFREVAGFGDML